MRTFRTLFNIWCISLVAGCIFELIPGYAHAQTSQELGRIDVEERPYGEEIIGPYNQPRWSARGGFSADTDVYVLPPFSFYLDLDYHGPFPRNGKSDHLFTQEFELGLPYRVQVAFELNQERQDGRTQVPFATIEARWAPANWGKIPLNPTLFAEYDFGIGKQYPVQPGANKEQDAPDEAGSLGVGDAVREQTTKNIAATPRIWTCF